jgi:hypothetical protein
VREGDQVICLLLLCRHEAHDIDPCDSLSAGARSAPAAPCPYRIFARRPWWLARPALVVRPAALVARPAGPGGSPGGPGGSPGRPRLFARPALVVGPGSIASQICADLICRRDSYSQSRCSWNTHPDLPSVKGAIYAHRRPVRSTVVSRISTLAPLARAPSIGPLGPARTFKGVPVGSFTVQLDPGGTRVPAAAFEVPFR